MTAPVRRTQRERDRELIAFYAVWFAVSDSEPSQRQIFAYDAPNEAYYAAARELNRIAKEARRGK